MYPKQIDLETVSRINSEVDIQTFNKFMHSSGQMIEELGDKGFDPQDVITYIWYTLFVKYKTKDPQPPEEDRCIEVEHISQQRCILTLDHEGDHQTR